MKSNNLLLSNKIEDILQDNETVFWQGKPVKKALVLKAIFNPLLFIVLIWGGIDGYLLSMILSNSMPTYVWFIIIGFFALHLLPVWFYIASIIGAAMSAKNIEYYVTNRRLIIKHGIVGINYESIMYTDVSNVTVRVGLIDRWCKLGSVVFTQTSSKHFIMSSIEEPYKVYRYIQKIVIDIKTDTYYPNDLRPESNRGYQTLYIPSDPTPVGKKLKDSKVMKQLKKDEKEKDIYDLDKRF